MLDKLDKLHKTQRYNHNNIQNDNNGDKQRSIQIVHKTGQPRSQKPEPNRHNRYGNHTNQNRHLY